VYLVGVSSGRDERASCTMDGGIGEARAILNGVPDLDDRDERSELGGFLVWASDDCAVCFLELLDRLVSCQCQAYSAERSLLFALCGLRHFGLLVWALVAV